MKEQENYVQLTELSTFKKLKELENMLLFQTSHLMTLIEYYLQLGASNTTCNFLEKNIFVVNIS